MIREFWSVQAWMAKPDGSGWWGTEHSRVMDYETAFSLSQDLMSLYPDARILHHTTEVVE